MQRLLALLGHRFSTFVLIRIQVLTPSPLGFVVGYVSSLRPFIGVFDVRVVVACLLRHGKLV